LDWRFWILDCILTRNRKSSIENPKWKRRHPFDGLRTGLGMRKREIEKKFDEIVAFAEASAF